MAHSGRNNETTGLRGNRLHVGPLASMEAMIALSGARYLVTAINKHMMPATPPGIAPDNHLRLGFNDIVAPAAGMTPPSAGHVQSLIAFASEWNHDGPLVIHCLAGISRSTASAFIVLCTLNPECPEELIAMRLRKASSTADPNARLIQLADDMLGRKGRMIRAIEEMEPATLSDVAYPFSLPSVVENDRL